MMRPPTTALRRALIIPALNEEASIALAVEEVSCELFEQVLVVDNGSTDATAVRAAQGGAEVVREPRRGYGQACWTGIQSLRQGIDTIVFMDGDLSDDPADAARLVETLEEGGYDLVIGSRVLGEADKGSLEPWQRFGNRLATCLIRLFWRGRFTDLGPFRAVRFEALKRMDMKDRGFGWTVEMQAKAAQMGLRTCEVPVRYRRRRYGRSKISGNLLGSLRAGITILWTLLRCLLSRQRPSERKSPQS